MKILLILAHPETNSFNHAIADTALQALREQGHEVIFHDLYAEKFNPVLPGPEIAQNAVLDPVVARHCDDVRRAEGMVIVHPSWWGQPPAILKGWVDRVFRAGVVYRFVAGEGGVGVPECLLGMGNALVFNTANTPASAQPMAPDALESFWNTNVLTFCGIKRIQRRLFAGVIASSLEQRQAWLQEVVDAVRKTFPAARPLAGSRQAA